jgi:MoxR-like ATPase
VLATQNPLEMEGTYPLPEAQLDRFLFKLQVPFPSRAELNEVVSRTILRPAIAVLAKVMDAGAHPAPARHPRPGGGRADEVRDFAVGSGGRHPSRPARSATESGQALRALGRTPRAAQALVRAGRVRALMHGRAHLACDDIRHLAVDVLQHRVILNYDGQAEGITVRRTWCRRSWPQLPESGAA